RGSLEEAAVALGVAQKVRFLGTLPLAGLKDLYRAVDGACVPSVWGEPFGYAIGEPMALRTPVAAFPVGAAPELLGEARGYLAENRPPQAMAASIRWMLADSSERKARAERA